MADTITINITETPITVTINVSSPDSVPTGGTAGQVLAKVDSANYNTEWVDQSGGSGGIQSVVGTSGEIDVDNTDPDNPVLSIPGTYASAILATVDGILVDYATLTQLAAEVLSASTPPIWSGQWRNGFLGSMFNTGVGWIGFVYTCPYLVGGSHTVTQIRWPVTTGIAASTIRLALYDDLDGYPNNLIEESGALSSASSGEIAYTFSSPRLLAGKLYHLALQVSSNSVAGRYWTGGISVLPRPALGTPFFSYSLSMAYGAFPATFTAGATKANIGVQPMLSLLIQ